MSSEFLFASLNSTKPLTARKVHIRRLYDILQLCIQRNDRTRARRAWSILARCKEVHWMSMWTTGLYILDTNLDMDVRIPMRLEYLRTVMLQNQEDREQVFNELILQLILSGQHKEALDELELYLPSFPYQDNPIFHSYAGLICLYLAQPQLLPLANSSSSFNSNMLRDAQSHFERAKVLDAENIVAQAFLEKIPTFTQTGRNGRGSDRDSDDDSMILQADIHTRKRVRATFN